MINKIHKISPSLLTSFEKCKLKFVLDSNIRRNKGQIKEFNPNSFMGNLIHKFLEIYFKENYELNLCDEKWESLLIEFSKKVKFEVEDVDVLDYIKYWVPSYYPKKINTFKIIKNYQLLNDGTIYPEKKVQFENVYGIIDLYEINRHKIRITDFKTGVLFNYEDGSHFGLKEAYIEQLKTYGYIIYNTEKILAENIELVIKGLGNNEDYSFRCTHEEYVEQGIKIDKLINQTNEVILRGNLALLATPEVNICNFCNHIFECTSLHESIRIEPDRWERIVLLHTINVTFDLSEFSINLVINDRTISIHNIPEKDFIEIEKMNKKGNEVIITHLFQVYDSRVKKWNKLTKYREIVI